MTTIRNIQTPTIGIHTKVIRKAARAAPALPGAALVIFAVFNGVVGAVTDWIASRHIVLLVVAVGTIALLGIRKNILESSKTQYDIR
jgi:hypothetical protein